MEGGEEELLPRMSSYIREGALSFGEIQKGLLG